jgi:hypothetical protein
MKTSSIILSALLATTNAVKVQGKYNIFSFIYRHPDISSLLNRSTQ